MSIVGKELLPNLGTQFLIFLIKKEIYKVAMGTFYIALRCSSDCEVF